MLIETLEASGFDAALLVEGTPLSLDALRDGRGWLDWETFLDLNDRALAITEGHMTPAELGARLAHVPSHTFIHTLAGHVLTARQLHRAATRWVTPSLFPLLRLDFRPSTADSFVLEGHFPPGRGGGESFFRICAGMIAEVSTLLGGPSADVELVLVGPGRVDFRVRSPALTPLRERAVRAVRAVLRVPETLAILARQQSEIDEGMKVLSQTRRDFQRLLEEFPNAVAIHRGGRILWANAAFAHLLGAAEGGPLLDRDLTTFIREDDRATTARALEHPAEPSSRRAEWRVDDDDGTTRWIELEQIPSVDFDGQPATILVATDVSEPRRLREELRIADRMASLGTLAATLGHDMNNPLAFLVAQLELGRQALAAGDTDRVAAALETAREGADRLCGVVSNLRARARGETPAATLIDVVVVLRQAMRIARETSTSHADLLEQLAEVPLVAGDRAGLGQVFMNLLVNALEAAPAGPPSPEVRVRSAAEPDGGVQITIADTGAGIPVDDAARIFEPFFTTKSSAGNTGMGLSISKRIVEEHGGQLEVRSVPPGEPLPAGERFRTEVVVRLPPATRSARPRELVSPSGVRRRVLVVDDEPNLLKSIELLLSSRHDIVCAGSGEAAVRQLEGDAAFDVVLCDLMMRGLDGIDVFDAVRRTKPDLAPRVVFMTGGAFTERFRAFLAESPNIRLDKPFATEAVLDAIESAARGVVH